MRLREQIDELEAFARPLGVEIFPVFEMLGNQGALLMLDDVRPFAEYPGAIRPQRPTMPSASCPIAFRRSPTPSIRSTSTPGSTSRGTWASARAKSRSNAWAVGRHTRPTTAASTNCSRVAAKR